MTGDITATSGKNNTDVAFKNCMPFPRCVTHINDEHNDTVENLDIIMPMYNLIKYSDNYSDAFGSLWQCKRDDLSKSVINPNVITVNSTSFTWVIFGDH